jgi:hypothetical protein
VFGAMASSASLRPAMEFVEVKSSHENQCVLCDKVYRSKYAARRHVEAVHQLLHLVSCPVSTCSKRFTNHSTAMRHAVREHEQVMVHCPNASCDVKRIDYLR